MIFIWSRSGSGPKRRAHDAIADIHRFGSRGYEWILDADIEACFDTIDQVALMDRVRARVTDKRVLTLVKSFLKAGILTELGEERNTPTGTPQGGIASPLLANFALSVLDEYLHRDWRPGGWMSTDNRRHRHRRLGLPTWRLVRYADLCGDIISSFRYASQKDWAAIAKDLKPVYTAPSEQAALDRFAEFSEKWEQRYPAIVRLWTNAWAEFVPFLAFDTEIRTVICTTNAIESINARVRKAVHARGPFPNEQAALKCVYLAIMSLDPTGTGRKRWSNRWKKALNAFEITFDGRLSAGRK